jgi:hypothetical protein
MIGGVNQEPKEDARLRAFLGSLPQTETSPHSLLHDLFNTRRYGLTTDQIVSKRFELFHGNSPLLADRGCDLGVHVRHVGEIVYFEAEPVGFYFPPARRAERQRGYTGFVKDIVVAPHTDNLLRRKGKRLHAGYVLERFADRRRQRFYVLSNRARTSQKRLDFPPDLHGIDGFPKFALYFERIFAGHNANVYVNRTVRRGPVGPVGDTAANCPDIHFGNHAPTGRIKTTLCLVLFGPRFDRRNKMRHLNDRIRMLTDVVRPNRTRCVLIDAGYADLEKTGSASQPGDAEVRRFSHQRVVGSHAVGD